MFTSLFALFTSLTALGLIIGAVYMVVIIGLIIWAAMDERHWWIPIPALLVVTVLAWILFHSWLFAAWSVLLFGAIYLVAKLQGAFWKILGIALALAICIAGLILTNRFTSIESKPVEVSQPACVEAVVVETQTHGDKVMLDLNDGDPFDYSLTVVNPDFPEGNKTLVVLVEPMYIFDVVYPKMYFTSYRLRGTQEQAICSAMKIAGKDALAYIYVGNASTPKGWVANTTAGWWTELTHKQYSEKAITTGVDSLPFQISTTDENRDLVSVDVLHGQLWNPTPKLDEKLTVVHPQVEEGYTLTVPFGWQGTYWTIADGKPELVQSRIIQTSKEVVERDSVSINPNDYGHMVLLYCGATVPTTELKIGEDTLNWETELEGWTCEVTKE